MSAQRYALDRERVGLVADATGNWVQVTDHWTVEDERDRLLATTAKLRERNEAMTRVLVAVRKRIRNVFVEDRVEDAIACRDCMEQIDALLPTPSVQT